MNVFLFIYQKLIHYKKQDRLHIAIVCIQIEQTQLRSKEKTTYSRRKDEQRIQILFTDNFTQTIQTKEWMGSWLRKTEAIKQKVCSKPYIRYKIF